MKELFPVGSWRVEISEGLKVGVEQFGLEFNERKLGEKLGLKSLARVKKGYQMLQVRISYDRLG